LIITAFNCGFPQSLLAWLFPSTCLIDFDFFSLYLYFTFHLFPFELPFFLFFVLTDDVSSARQDPKCFVLPVLCLCSSQVEATTSPTPCTVHQLCIFLFFHFLPRTSKQYPRRPSFFCDARSHC
jgi:hypothetical protein